MGSYKESINANPLGRPSVVCFVTSEDACSRVELPNSHSQLSRGLKLSGLGVDSLPDFARLHEEHIGHGPRDRLDWVQSALVLLGYAAYDETW